MAHKKKPRKTRSRLFVNVYELDRCYGGPEEGGWWFTCGEPVASEPAKRGHQAERIERQRIAEYCPEAQGQGKWQRQKRLRSCGYDVRIERHPGRPFPARRPFYD